MKALQDLAMFSPLSLLKENKDGWIPLHDAALCGQTECLKTLLKGKAFKGFCPPANHYLTQHPLCFVHQPIQVRWTNAHCRNRRLCCLLCPVNTCLVCAAFWSWGPTLTSPTTTKRRLYTKVQLRNQRRQYQM